MHHRPPRSTRTDTLFPYTTLFRSSASWGSAYVNQFIDRGRVKRVFVQGDAPSRMLPEDFGQWYVRNEQGEMVPFSAFSSGHWTYGPPILESYHGITYVEILGQPAPGISTGEAMPADAARLEERRVWTTGVSEV